MREKLTIGYCPTRRDVFSAEEAQRFQEIIRKKMDEFPITVVDLEGINNEKLLFSDKDINKIIERFSDAGVDALFFPHCNFGSENRVAQVAKALGCPVLIWGPRDDAPFEDGLRSRDSQCGMFATGKVLRRYNIPFTYLTNSWVDSEEFVNGFRDFLKVAAAVKAFRHINILQISTRPEPFCSVICNEAELIEKFNIHVVPINMNELVTETATVEREKPDDYKNTIDFVTLHNSCGTPNQISRVAALKVAMRHLAEKYNCNAIAIQCWTALQDMLGVMPCFANGMLTVEGLPTVCEADINGAVTALVAQALCEEGDVPFFADVTVRHPYDDNAELLWHCGNFPYTLAKGDISVGVSRYHDNHYGIGEFCLRDGNITVCRFDGDHGDYRLFIGECETVDGPKNVGSYVWIKTADWPRWEHRLVEGPYIHHVSGIYGKVGDLLKEFCKYIPYLTADFIE